MINQESNNPKDGMFFDGYASIFNIKDKENDIVLLGAFEPIYHNIPLLKEHNTSTIIGYIQKAVPDNLGLRVWGFINTNDPEGETTAQLISDGALKGLSIGYLVKESINDSTGRVIQKADLLEVSIVAIPTNELAQITSYNMPNSPTPSEGYETDNPASNQGTSGVPQPRTYESMVDKKLADVLRISEKLSLLGIELF
jgi:HK97 family phage prohead protease